jgi:hypothetical protein
MTSTTREPSSNGDESQGGGGGITDEIDAGECPLGSPTFYFPLDGGETASARRAPAPQFVVMNCRGGGVVGEIDASESSLLRLTADELSGSWVGGRRDLGFGWDWEPRKGK